VAVNCGGLAPSLVEAELFGHTRGAFSGAVSDRPGYLRSADRGTLFLDEVGELSAPAQAALLRALQQREVVPVGSSAPIAIDTRLCSATNRDLPALVGSGAFREDLYARLLGFSLKLPPLRERRCDLGLLVASLLRRLPGGERARFAPAAAYALLRYDWPLNVRELERSLGTALALAGDQPIAVEHLPEAVAAAATISDEADRPAPSGERDDTLRGELLKLLARHHGNIAAVAREMGKQREQIHRWARRLRIDLTSFRR
jgi:transcriptional regulator with GAF, ATPase, and Fis domain